MSRVGKNPVVVPQGVSCEFSPQGIVAKGILGEISLPIPDALSVRCDDDKIYIQPLNTEKKTRTLWGTTRNLLQNIVTGVSKGFVVQLEIEGVGYRAAVQGSILKLQLGYSHDIDFQIPSGVQIKCEKPTSIAVSGFDRQQVGEVAAKIMSFRKVEPYKGKGIRKKDQVIIRKEGKKK